MLGKSLLSYLNMAVLVCKLIVKLQCLSIFRILEAYITSMSLRSDSYLEAHVFAPATLSKAVYQMLISNCDIFAILSF